MPVRRVGQPTRVWLSAHYVNGRCECGPRSTPISVMLAGTGVGETAVMTAAA